MDVCVACGSKLIDGITKCPDCGARLNRQGMGLIVFGWVMVMASLVPLSIGIVTVQQRSFVPIILGGALTLAGFVLVTFGSVRVSATPVTTRKAEPEAVPLPGTQSQVKR